MEIDAATYSGVDTMREITGMAQYAALGDNPRKLLIIDECHALTKQTWQALLKSIEEPPEHVFWVLCTTEADKVPATIKTRCHAYELKPVGKTILREFIEYVYDQEEADAQEATDPSVLDYIAEASDGSVRQALVYYSMCMGIQTRKEAHELLSQAEESSEVIELVRMIATGKGFSWEAAMGSLARMPDQSPEGVRIVTVNYVGKMLQGSRDGKVTARLLNVLDAFKEPFRPNEKNAPLLLAIGRILFAE